MATYIDSTPQGRQGRLIDRALAFQRGNRTHALRQNRRRLTLRIKHVLAMLAVLAGFFLALDKVYLFLVSWDKLTIKRVEYGGCSRMPLRRDLYQFFKTHPLGNILLCDIEGLRKRLCAFPWIKDVRIQKVFPSMIRIEVQERVPFALLRKDSLVLVDEDAVELESVSADESYDLPVVSDHDSSAAGLAEKWPEVEACLKSIPLPERNRLAALECADDGRITIIFKDDPIRLIVDDGDVFDRLQFFTAHRADWVSRFGALDYVDLRFEDRVILRPTEQAANGLPLNPPKETD